MYIIDNTVRTFVVSTEGYLCLSVTGSLETTEPQAGNLWSKNSTTYKNSINNCNHATGGKTLTPVLPCDVSLPHVSELMEANSEREDKWGISQDTFF